MEKPNVMLTYTFCPECGYGVKCDEDGLCMACGSTATGPGVEAIMDALGIILDYGSNDGEHHKAWVIDQVVRKLVGHQYDGFVKDACAGDEGPNTFGWDAGIAP